jgi:hypothetical protein
MLVSLADNEVLHKTMLHQVLQIVVKLINLDLKLLIGLFLAAVVDL